VVAAKCYLEMSAEVYDWQSNSQLKWRAGVPAPKISCTLDQLPVKMCT